MIRSGIIMCNNCSRRVQITENDIPRIIGMNQWASSGEKLYCPVCALTFYQRRGNVPLDNGNNTVRLILRDMEAYNH